MALLHGGQVVLSMVQEARRITLCLRYKGGWIVDAAGLLLRSAGGDEGASYWVSGLERGSVVSLSSPINQRSRAPAGLSAL